MTTLFCVPLRTNVGWTVGRRVIGLLVVEGVVAGVVATTVDLFVGGSLSSFSFVKIVLYNLSWNSFANIAACFSGLSFSSVFFSQSKVMFLLLVPVSKIQDITRTYGKIGWGRFLTYQHQLTNCQLLLDRTPPFPLLSSYCWDITNQKRILRHQLW